MNGSRFFLILLLLIPVQTVLLEPLSIGGVKPDLALIIVISRAWTQGAKVGIGWGLALGGVLDLFTGGVFAMHFVLKSLAGFVAGISRLPFLGLSLRAYALIVIFISVIHDFMGLIFVSGFDPEIFASKAAFDIVLRAGINAALAVLILLIFSKNEELKGQHPYGGTIFSPGRGSGTRR